MILYRFRPILSLSARIIDVKAETLGAAYEELETVRFLKKGDVVLVSAQRVAA